MISKFRAWDKEKDRMIYPSTLGVCFELDDDGINVVDVDVDYPIDHIFPRIDSELMQSTGLKDINGVEIFEGDIVRCTVDNWSNGEKFEQIDKVVYEDCMFTFSDGYKYDCSITEPTYLSKEVIGNIYENPDLLEAE